MNIAKKFTTLFLVIALLIPAACVPRPAYASVPQTMTYQGILKDASSNYLTGTYAMVFKLYSASTGGTALWTETQSGVSVSSGKFSVTLGSVTAINLAFNADYWLGITVGTDAEMTPRIKLTSVGYVFQSENVVNSFTQSQHDALTHKNVEGVKDNTVLIGKTNFKLDAYSVAAANTMGDMVLDTFSDASGISAVSSTNYTWRGSSNFDVVVTPTGGGNDSNAKLLLHANGTNGSTIFTDSSSGAKTVTANGSAQMGTAQSKFGGASAFLNGAGAYLTLADHADFDLSGGIWTIDLWVRVANLSHRHAFFEQGSSGNEFMTASVESDGSVKLIITRVGAQVVVLQTAASKIAATAWKHIALVENGDAYKIYVDGVEEATATNTNRPGDFTGSPAIGMTNYIAGGGQFEGDIDEYRFSKGVARWTAAFTPPTSEYAAPSSTGTATVISNAYTEPVAPTEAIVIADEVLNGGTITYSVSRDNGTTWTTCTKETLCNISGQPSGTQLKWKAVITDAAELNAISVAV